MESLRIDQGVQYHRKTYETDDDERTYQSYPQTKILFPLNLGQRVNAVDIILHQFLFRALSHPGPILLLLMDSWLVLRRRALYQNGKESKTAFGKTGRI
jgi:hypothetical protein